MNSTTHDAASGTAKSPDGTKENPSINWEDIDFSFLADRHARQIEKQLKAYKSKGYKVKSPLETPSLKRDFGQALYLNRYSKFMGKRNKALTNKRVSLVLGGLVLGAILPITAAPLLFIGIAAAVLISSMRSSNVEQSLHHDVEVFLVKEGYLDKGNPEDPKNALVIEDFFSDPETYKWRQARAEFYRLQDETIGLPSALISVGVGALLTTISPIFFLDLGVACAVALYAGLSVYENEVGAVRKSFKDLISRDKLAL